MPAIRDESSLNFQGQTCPTWACCCAALSVCYFHRTNKHKASPHQGGQDCSTNTFKSFWAPHLHFVQPVLQIIPFDCDEWGAHTLHRIMLFQSMWVEMCLHMEFWYMCQSQDGNSNGVQRFCDQINHLGTEEWHFLTIRQLPNCFITRREGIIPGTSTQVLWRVLGWAGLWFCCWVFLHGSLPNYPAFHALPCKPHSQYSPWAFPEGLYICGLAQGRTLSGIAPIWASFSTFSRFCFTQQ